MITAAYFNTPKYSPIINRYDSSSSEPWKWVTVTKSEKPLPIKISPPYDKKNEIGILHNGDRIRIRDDIRSGPYVWTYVDSLKKGGWVNINYVK